jgi:hypothetical protein
LVVYLAVVRKRNGDSRARWRFAAMKREAFCDEWIVIGDGRLVAIDAW